MDVDSWRALGVGWGEFPQEFGDVVANRRI